MSILQNLKTKENYQKNTKQYVSVCEEYYFQ